MDDDKFLFFTHSLLIKQLVEPVNWMKTIQNIFKGRTTNSKIYEVGPGRQLRAMIYRIDRTLMDNFTPYFLLAAIHHLKSSPTFSVRPCSSVGRVTVDLIRRSWVRFPPRSKDFFHVCVVPLIFKLG